MRRRPPRSVSAARSSTAGSESFAADLASLSVDPARAGWRRGTLAAPANGHGHDGRRPVQLACVRGGDGPGVLLVCTDGDPVTGAALAALALELSPGELAGGCVVVPDASRLDADLRDAFDTLLVARSALVIELGTGSGPGGPRLDWSPVAVVHPPPGRRRADPTAEAAMVAFGAPESLRSHGLDAWAGVPARPRPDIDLDDARATRGDRSRAMPLSARAARLGVPHVEVRCGGDPACERLSTLRTGCRNVLVDAGVLMAARELRATRHLEIGVLHAGSGPRRADVDTVTGATPAQHIGTTVRAGAAGELRMDARPGEDVHAGTVLARLFDPRCQRTAPTELLAPCDGVLLARRADGPFASGEPLALIAEPMQP